MNIGLHHFRLVDAIVKEGTLTRAADTLHLTQSALSHQLKELEHELGLSVFFRNGKRLELTPEGTRFLHAAERVLAELISLEADMRHIRDGVSGTLRVTTQCYTAYHWLPGIIKQYKRISPSVNIHVVSAATYVPLEYLLRGDVDIAIVRNKLDNPRINYEPIFEDQVFAILSKNHPLAGKSHFCTEDFEGQELFLPFNDPASGNIPVIENLMKAHHVTPHHVHRIHYTDAIIEMVDANLGISTLADWIVQPYLENRDIVALPLPAEVANRTWCAATCKDTPAIREFLRCLKLHFQNIPLPLSSDAV
ncbi:LysR family transcriptional regulator [Dinghuibacter silviterrae]|uniref:LysR family transcriptional regulator for metE and metH n=1 Tax=Dinghuibacter silviterrae TaxID=1539049 RepID=A0A4R8DG68_9BACT|nr:LysR family transcriptional regulator [Dinghuibacter silviterrae]TDW96447.1 LysR family transcriptional regulator for metE and metH [Dinghuibacter silviterrae]